MGYTAEENAEIRKLALYTRANPGTTARMRTAGRDGVHRGHLSVEETSGPDLAKRTVVKVRDSSRRRRQWRAVLDVGELEIKVGARFRPAREVLEESGVASPEEIVAEADEQVLTLRETVERHGISWEQIGDARLGGMVTLTRGRVGTSVEYEGGDDHLVMSISLDVWRTD